MNKNKLIRNLTATPEGIKVNTKNKRVYEHLTTAETYKREPLREIKE